MIRAPVFLMQVLWEGLVSGVLYALIALGFVADLPRVADLQLCAGQLSLGTGAFIGVGAYACYKLITIFPEMSLIAATFLSGGFSAAIGVVFGLPSLRIKGFQSILRFR